MRAGHRVTERAIEAHEMSSLVFYPTSPKEALVREFVGKSISDVPTPAAVMNVAAARRNCERMLEAVGRLGLGWRAHVKTHKVRERGMRTCKG